jgi:ABC-type glycerol-3-phosphate transport system permease component
MGVGNNKMLGIVFAHSGLVLLFLISFLISWGDYPYPLIILSSREKFTVPLGLATHITKFDTWWNQVATAHIDYLDSRVSFRP